uniref:Fork-head domain-containing protein n=1 Tax=Rhodnius prolixus TaxID=13249 RepID=T1HHF2_RHOPR
MDVDLFFGPGYDMLSLDEMLEGDIKYSVELGLELKENSLSGPGDLCSVADRGSLDWGDLNHSTLDLLGVDTTPGMMVNPKWVIPSLEKTTQIKDESNGIKEEIKSECEDNAVIDDETDEGNFGLSSVEQEDDEDEEEEEEDQEAEDSEEEEVVSKLDGTTLWNRMLNRPIQPIKSQRVGVINTQKAEPILPRNTMKKEGISLLRVNSKVSISNKSGKILKSAEQQLQSNSLKRTQQHMIVHSRQQSGSVIRVKPLETMKVTSRIVKSPIITSDNVKKQILVTNGTGQSPNNGRIIQTIKTKAPISNTSNNANNSRSVLVKRFLNIESYPKPAYSYSCLIAMALKNSVTGSLPVSEIYNFMCEHFPYFKSAPSGWKNSVRHNLSLNKCFEKIEKGGPTGSGCRKGCLWAMNPDKISKMDDEVAKWSKKDPNAIRRAMKYPEDLEKLERGDMKIGFSRTITIEDECEDEDERSEVEDESGRESCEEEEEEEEDEEDEDENDRQIESCGGEELDSEDEGEVPPSLRPFDQNNRLDFPHSRHSSVLSSSRLPLDLSDEMYEELDLLHQVVSSEEESEVFNVSQAKRPRLQCVLSPVHRQP